MRAEQFIKDHGVKKARELLKRLHELGCPDDMQITVINGMWNRTANGFTYPDLKRSVESVDQIDAFDYGLAEAKDLLNNMKRSKEEYTINFEVPAFEQAIADYESIYGEGNE